MRYSNTQSPETGDTHTTSASRYRASTLSPLVDHVSLPRGRTMTRSVLSRVAVLDVMRALWTRLGRAPAPSPHAHSCSVWPASTDESHPQLCQYSPRRVRYPNTHLPPAKWRAVRRRLSAPAASAHGASPRAAPSSQARPLDARIAPSMPFSSLLPSLLKPSQAFSHAPPLDARIAPARGQLVVGSEAQLADGARGVGQRELVLGCPA